ncbi:MAG: DUF58 domain-containing protein [Thermodesulforhabdaceae bacterium]
MLASMLVSGMTSQYNLKELKVKIFFPSDIFAKKPFPVVVEVTNNRHWFPAFFIRINFLEASSVIMFLRAGQSQRISLQPSFPERGLYRSVPLFVSSRFPFNFFSRSIFVELEEDIIVYPEPYSCNIPVIESQKEKPQHGGDEHQIAFGWLDDEIISIRNYQEGDPKKSINWKATAKTGNLKVNERSLEKPQAIILNINENDDIEPTLSCLVYLAIKFIGMGYLVGLKGTNLFIPPETGTSHLRSILRALALYGLNNVNDKTS